MRPILFRQCRSDSDDGSGEMIRAILTTCGSAWKNCRIFDRRVAGCVVSNDDDSGEVV